MQSKRFSADVKSLLKAQAQAQRQSAEVLDALADALPDDGATDDPLLTYPQIKAECGLGPDGAKAAIARGDLTASRGPRGKVLVARSELRRYLTSRPVAPRKAPPAADLGDWERRAEKSLRSIGGGRK